MIDIAPPSTPEVPKKIPPRELIKQKIAESEPEGFPPSPIKEKEITSVKPSPAPIKQKSKNGMGVVLALIFIFLLIFGLFGAIGFLYLQSTSFNSKLSEVKQAAQTTPQEFETQKTKLEALEKESAELKKSVADKIKALEDKVNKISPANYADKTKVEKLETVLKTTDSDKDGITDYEEVIVYESNPNAKDTDGDGYNDKIEIDNGYSPSGPGKLGKKSEEKTTTEVEKVTQVKVYKYAFDPAQLEAKVGEKVKLEITSLDTEHTFTIDELNINQKITTGGTAVVEFTPTQLGEFTYYSNILEDKGKGMVGKLTVK